AMRDRDENIGDAQTLGDVLGRAAHEDARFAGEIVADFHIGPAQAAPPAGAETLQNRFLGGPAAGKMLDGVFALLAVADLPVGVHPRQEHFAVLFDHAADAQAFDDIGADAKDFHVCPPSSPIRFLLVILAKTPALCKIRCCPTGYWFPGSALKRGSPLSTGDDSCGARCTARSFDRSDPRSTRS